MGSSLARSEWKPEESAGKRWTPEQAQQAGLALLGEVPHWQLLPAAVVAQATFNGALVEAARYSGLEDQQLADALHISAGYMSKFMRGVAQAWARRMVAYMRATRSLAPLQWMAHQVGCDVVPRESSSARIRELEDELHKLRRRA